MIKFVVRVPRPRKDVPAKEYEQELREALHCYWTIVRNGQEYSVQHTIKRQKERK